MARDKVFASAADRQAAYRARKLEAQEDFSGTPSPDTKAVKAQLGLDSSLFTGRGDDTVALEAYVARELAITKAQTSDPDKLRRSEAYARWRWREFYAGTVSSL